MNKTSAILQILVFSYLEGDFVVFLIGMRISRFWKFHKWIPVARAMPKMLVELSRSQIADFSVFSYMGDYLLSLYSIGKLSNNWKLMRKTETGYTILPEKLLTRRLKATVMLGFGTKHTR
jgi:hypothetical protein